MPILPSTHGAAAPANSLGVYFSSNQDNVDQDDTVPSRKQHSPSLLVTDACLLVLHFVQMFAVLHSLALRWPWPLDWLHATKVLLLANLDIWEFQKLTIDGAYKHVQNYNTPSTLMAIQYLWILLTWAIVLTIAFIVFVAIYAVLLYKKPPQILVRVAQLKRVYIVAAQVLCLPLGITLARLFHCNDSDMMDVNNTIPCFQKTHWFYLTPALAVVVILYILFPLWLIFRTKTEMLNLTADRHEGYLQLKEMEYACGLDMLWVVGNFHIFSSFRKNGAHFRAGLYYFNFLVLVLYAAFFKSITTQAMLVDIILCLAMIAVMVLRPFRVTAYNGMLAVNMLCLTLNGLLGALQVKFTASTVQMVYLLPDYLIIILSVINGCWLALCLTFILYVSLHGVRRCCNKSLWPTDHSLEHLQPRTHKYVMAVLHSRILIGKLARNITCAEIQVKKQLCNNDIRW